MRSAATRPLVPVGDRWSLLACAALALLVGAMVPFYVGAMGDGVSRLMILPAAIVLFLLFVLDKFLLLTLILLFRASADLLFETTRISLGGYAIGLGGVVNAFVCLITLTAVLQHRDKIDWRGIRIWLPFVALFSLSFLYAPDRGDALRAVLAICSYFAIFVAAFFYVGQADGLNRCFRIVLWSSVIPVLYAFVDMALNFNTTAHYGFRVKSTFTHPNIFAFYLLLIVSVVLYALKSDQFKLPAAWRPVLYGYMMLVIGLLLMTKTRSAWVACFAIFAIYGLMFERRYLLYLIVAPAVALMIPAVQERLLDLGTPSPFAQYERLNSFAWRQLIWEDGLRWMEPIRYVFGYGAGAFTNYSTLFFSGSGGKAFGAHNVYVQLFFDSGIVGLVAYLNLLIGLIAVIRRMVPRNRLSGVIAIAMIAQYAIIAASDNMLIYLAYNWYVWFIAGAVVASVLRSEREEGVMAPSGSPSQRSG